MWEIQQERPGSPGLVCLSWVCSSAAESSSSDGAGRGTAPAVPGSWGWGPEQYYHPMPGLRTSLVTPARARAVREQLGDGSGTAQQEERGASQQRGKAPLLLHCTHCTNLGKNILSQASGMQILRTPSFRLILPAFSFPCCVPFSSCQKLL